MRFAASIFLVFMLAFAVMGSGCDHATVVGDDESVVDALRVSCDCGAVAVAAQVAADMQPGVDDPNDLIAVAFADASLLAPAHAEVSVEPPAPHGALIRPRLRPPRLSFA